MRDSSLADAVVQSSLDGFAVIDREGRYTLWNRAMERFAGKTAAEVLGRVAFEVFPFLRDHGLDVAVERALAGETVATEGVEHVEPDGTRRVYDRLYLPLRQGGEVTGVIAIIRDATARHAAQDALRRTEAMLLMAAEAAGIGLWTWDPATDTVIWDDTMCRLYSLPPGGAPRGREAYLALMHPDDREPARQRIAQGVGLGHWEHEYRVLRPDGSVRWIAARARIIRSERGGMALGAVFDVTERKEMEERQRASQRLEVVGHLTAGIAHNFNNMLMGMLPNLEMAALRAPPELAPLLRDAEQAGHRAAEVVRQLLTYAGRNQPAVRRVEPVGLLVGRTVAFCRTTFDRRIHVEFRCHDGAAAALDASQVEQAVLNLLINARDALEEGAPASPQITVEVESVAPGAPELEGRPGDWVAIRVGDNGIGMDEATVQRIFEPFFTTKPAGRGTGLGLATTQGIVREHGGFLACRSARGRGTTFTLYLPSSPLGRASAEQAARSAGAATPDAAPQPATVLVVDDDDRVRTATVRILEVHGFEVKTAASGDEALAIMKDPGRASGVRLVLLDVSMPGLSGPETREKLRAIAPRVPVVFLSGYAFDPELGDVFLQKPVTGSELVLRLREILRAAGSGG